MSARENLTLGRADATEDEIAEALEIAQAGFVHDLPWGLDTRIGEQGMSLSGGQRQRLALARAVLAQPQVLVLDDTLSALDVHTEKLVEEALRRVLADDHRPRRRPPGLDGAAGRPGRAAPGRHDHPRRRPPRAARDRAGLPRAARRRRRATTRGGVGMSASHALDHARTATTPRGPARRAGAQELARRRRRRHADDELSAETTGRLADRSRRLLGDLLRRYRAAHLAPGRRRADRERRAPVDPVPGQGGHRHRHPADPARTTTSSRCS